MADLYIGLMSGTSMDAVDAALVDFDEAQLRLVETHSLAIAPDLREALLRLIAARPPHPLQCLGELDSHLGRLFSDAVNQLLEKADIAREAVQAIGSHGQTVYHQPSGPTPFTLQIGDPNRIAETTGITTVADFRRRDIVVGGQGAPLVPAFHAALFQRPDLARVVVNVGGMANVTLLPAEEGAPVTGFDTGPGNVLLDTWCYRNTGKAYDKNGQWAATGEIDASLLERMLSDPYFDAPPPKSTGREYFNEQWLLKHLASEAAADVQATLSELTARTIERAIRQHAPHTSELLVCGGGSRNGDFMTRLRLAMSPCPVETTEACGLDPDWVEAVAFAWLARRTLHAEPGNLPEVTGATHPVVLGGIYPARAYIQR